MHEEHGFSWLAAAGITRILPDHIAMAAIIVCVILAATFVARVQLTQVMQSSEGGLVPEPKLSYRNFFEIVAESLFKLTESVIGHHDAPIYFPIIGTLFVFIFTSNIVGLIPGVTPATDNINTTMALGLFVFVYYNYAGLRAHGLKYFKHFLGPVIWLSPLMFVIEIVSHLARPLSLALRLRGNIAGDHLVLGIFNGLVPYGIPVIFYGLGVFVSFIQAFVFCLMTMVYISLSTMHDEH